MWNYRVVRRRTRYIDSKDKRERVDYSYAIHEAYYDQTRHVGAITEEAVEPYGDDIEELRHSWMMMAEAFGQPILDYDEIPECGYESAPELVGSVTDDRFPFLEAGDVDEAEISEMPAKERLELKYGTPEEEKYRERQEEKRVEKESVHEQAFIGTPSLKELISKLYTDYEENILQEKDEA